MLPLNSLTAFTWGVLVTNNFDRFPAFCFFSIGWIMLACNDQARQAPSPWHKARRYPPLLKALIFNTNVKADIISVNEGAEAMDMYSKGLEEKAKRLERQKQAEADYVRKLKEELGLSEKYDEKESIVSTKQRLVESISTNPLILPFKSTLYPIQKELRKRVIQLRIVTSVVTWQEKIYAFWITNMAFIAAMICFWMPWAFILKWVLRIVVWVFLGPWAAILVRHHFPETRNMTDDEWNETVERRIQKSRHQAIEASTTIQVRKETVLKGKALARWMFGRYHLRVPRFTEQLFPDVPLPVSFSEKFESANDLAPFQAKERIYGQRFFGNMIPKREMQVDQSRILQSKDDVFISAGLKSYFESSFGWASFVNVTKVTYVVGYGISKGRVYAKIGGKEAHLVGYSTLRMASAGLGMGTTYTSEIIFFQDEAAYKRFSKGNYEIEGGAKVTIRSISADFTAGTTGIPLVERVMALMSRANNNHDKTPRYHHGMAIFVLNPKGGMMADISLVGQKFTFEAA